MTLPIADFRFALRSLRRTPTFTLVALVTLALGIGATTAIFSVLYGVLLRPLPYPDSGRLIGIQGVWSGSPFTLNLTYTQFRFLQERAPGLESFAAYTPVGLNLFDGREGARVDGLRVSATYFRTLGVRPRLGREFVAEEDQPAGPDAVILSDGLWRERFGGDPALVGQTVRLDGRPFAVVGIMPPDFHAIPDVAVWTTLAQVARTIGSGQNLTGVGRLAPGVSLDLARAGLAGTVAAFREEFKGSVSPQLGIELAEYRRLVSDDLRTPVQVLFGAIGFVLLIACANVANLILGRSAGRSRELAVRVALGASRGQLLRQLLVESLVLAAAGGALGLLVAQWMLTALLAVVPESLARGAEIRLDGWALAFTSVVALATGLLFGLIPGWQVVRRDLHPTLKEGGRSTGGAGQGRARHVLVVTEIALSLVLLAGAGLLLQAFARLLRTDPGFEPAGLVSAEIWLTGTRYDSTATVAGFYRDLTARLGAYPGVRSAAVVEAGLPLERGGNLPVSLDGERLNGSVDYRTVTPDYFTVLGSGLRDGRGFGAADDGGAAPVVVVNETFARTYLADRALGRQLKVGGNSQVIREVVGVVRDVKSFVGLPVPPTVFLPSAQTPVGLTQIFSSWFPTHVLVRAEGGTGELERQLPRLIHEIDPQVPVGRVRAMDQVLAASLAFQRFVMLLLALFAALAVALAGVGIYGLMAHLVVQRRHEIGIRLALGALPRDVMGLVLRRGMVLAAVGSGIGLAGAAGLTRLLDSLLYGVPPIQVVTFTGVTLLLAIIALVACYLPARRATTVDPLLVLRAE